LLVSSSSIYGIGDNSKKILFICYRNGKVVVM
jgi:hypothetical protein